MGVGCREIPYFKGEPRSSPIRDKGPNPAISVLQGVVLPGARPSVLCNGLRCPGVFLVGFFSVASRPATFISFPFLIVVSSASGHLAVALLSRLFGAFTS